MGKLFSQISNREKKTLRNSIVKFWREYVTKENVPSLCAPPLNAEQQQQQQPHKEFSQIERKKGKKFHKDNVL